MGKSITRHAEARSQQRGIMEEVMDVLRDFGDEYHSRGAFSYSMSRESRCIARREIGESEYRRLEKWLNRCYMVVSRDESVITVAYRIRRFKKNWRPPRRRHSLNLMEAAPHWAAFNYDGY